MSSTCIFSCFLLLSLDYDYSFKSSGIVASDCLTAGPMIKYLLKKNQWTFETMQRVNWNNLEQALNSYNKPFFRTKLAQLMHDWQHTGNRKAMMAEGTDDCPCQCAMKENKLHYLYYPAIQIAGGRRRLLTMLQQQLKSTNTYPGITTSIGKILMKGFEGEWWKELQTQNVMEQKLQDIIEKQRSLGDMSLAKGYMIQEWKELQATWEITLTYQVQSIIGEERLLLAFTCILMEVGSFGMM